MTHYVQKAPPASPCAFCGSLGEGQCAGAAAVATCGVFRVRRDYVQAIHFVGFRGEEYHSAVRVWGRPDFYHRGWDLRARRDVAPGDTVVFAAGEHDQAPHERSFDDSNERDDPAYWERLNRPMPINRGRPR